MAPILSGASISFPSTLPSIVMVPDVGDTKPKICFINIVFPEPFRPTSVESLDSVQAHRALTIPAISALYVILLLVSFVAIYYQSKRIMITDLQGNNEQ